MTNFCKIVQDLLPNYIEKTTFDETNQFIEEHLENCDECTKIANSMKSELGVHTENIEEEVDYMKKFNKEVKHLKFWKKVLIAFILIIGILAEIILYRYCILTKIYNWYVHSKEISNIYYTCESNDGTTFKYSKKDNIIVQKTFHDTKEKSMLWKDLSTGECLYFVNNIYMDVKLDVLHPSEYLPCSSDFLCEDFMDRLKMAINPSFSLKSIYYEGKECYKFKREQEGAPYSLEAIYEKDTGFLLYTSGLAYADRIFEWQNGETKWQYRINSVTDEDIAKPDLSQYEYTKARSIDGVTGEVIEY